MQERGERRRRGLLRPRPVLFAVGLAALIVVVLSAVDDRDGFSLIDGQTPGSYLAIFALVAADAVIPVFPGETTLNAGSTLASQGELTLWLVMLAGGLGAIVGDSTLFLIARRSRSLSSPSSIARRQTRRSKLHWISSIAARRCCC